MSPLFHLLALHGCRSSRLGRHGRSGHSTAQGSARFASYAQILLAVVAPSATRVYSQTTWQVQQITASGFAQDPFTDGHTVVWSDGTGVHKYVDGLQSTLATTGIRPVVNGNKYAWVESDKTISNNLNTLVYDDGTGPKNVFSAQPLTDTRPIIYNIPERPSLVGNQLAFTYGLGGGYANYPEVDWVHYQVGLYERGTLTYPLNPTFDINTYGSSSFPSTNGSRVVWATEYQTGQEQIFQWSNGSRSAISPVVGGFGLQDACWAVTTGDHVFYTLPISGSSSNVIRYTYATQASEVVGQSTWVDPRATWACDNRVIFTGTARDLVLWSSGSSRSLDGAASSSGAGVSSQNVAWFSFASGTSVDVLLYDGIATRLLGSYPTPFSQPTLSVTDQLVTWNMWDGNLYIATAVPEPSTCFSLAAGLAIGYLGLRCRRTSSS